MAGSGCASQAQHPSPAITSTFHPRGKCRLLTGFPTHMEGSTRPEGRVDPYFRERGERASRRSSPDLPGDGAIVVSVNRSLVGSRDY